MTTSEAIDVFKKYLTTKIVPRPMELIEASKIAIKVLTQQLEETDKYWKPSEKQMAVLLNAEGLVRANNYIENARILAEVIEELKKL